MSLFNKKHKRTGDIKSLNANSIIDYIKINLKNPTKQNVAKAMKEIAKPDADQEHMIKEGDTQRFPWGWHMLNKDFTEQIINEHKYFFDKWMGSKKLSPKEQCWALNDFIVYMNDVKKICYEKNECFIYWFEGCIADDEYLEKLTNELEYLKTNLKQLQSDYDKKKMLLSNLDRVVRDKLVENEGILQSDFVKLFDEMIHHEVKEILYQMAKEGELQREKQGRSYILTLKGE